MRRLAVLLATTALALACSSAPQEINVAQSRLARRLPARINGGYRLGEGGTAYFGVRLVLQN